MIARRKQKQKRQSSFDDVSRRNIELCTFSSGMKWTNTVPGMDQIFCRTRMNAIIVFTIISKDSIVKDLATIKQNYYAGHNSLLNDVEETGKIAELLDVMKIMK